MAYCAYLRKSRADLEAERHGEFETLAHHEAILRDLSKRLKIRLTKIYRELVSGETISARPVMQQLLEDVENNMWEGVLVVEVERLARGDTKDQGIVAEAFKFSDTKIITPLKTYNPNDEYDEEYFEFGLFMSRREYRIINRRNQRGRIEAIKEGKYISGTAPYGYERVRLTTAKGFTLKPIPEQAEVVKMIFYWYAYGEVDNNGNHIDLGMYKIAGKLDDLNIPPSNSSSKHWSRHTIKDILTNITYTGKVRWQWRKEVKERVNGEIVKRRRKAVDDNYMFYDGLHPAIVDMETFEKVQEILKHNIKTSVPGSKTLQNPLAGILICGKCGHTMMRTPPSGRRFESILCPERTCNNVSSSLALVEQEIINALQLWLDNYKLDLEVNNEQDKLLTNKIKMKEAQLENMYKELTKLNKQHDNTYDLLEQGIYTTELFLERNKKIDEKIQSLDSDIAELKLNINDDKTLLNKREYFIPQVQNVINIYYTLESIEQKNNLLKTVLEKVEYVKLTPNTKGNRNNANFELTLYPLIPHK